MSLLAVGSSGLMLISCLFCHTPHTIRRCNGATPTSSLHAVGSVLDRAFGVWLFFLLPRRILLFQNRACVFRCVVYHTDLWLVHLRLYLDVRHGLGNRFWHPHFANAAFCFGCFQHDHSAGIFQIHCAGELLDDFFFSQNSERVVPPGGTLPDRPLERQPKQSDRA